MPRGRQKGFKHTEEWKRQNSLRHLGRKCSEETKRKISEALTGKHYQSLETRKKMSEARKGIPHTEEWKQKRRGIPAWNKGRIGIYTKETIEKIRLANIGKKLSEETKIKISNSLKGKNTWNVKRKGKYHCSEETKEKIRTANKGQIPWITGKNHSEETKKKISEKNKGKKRSIEVRKRLSKKMKGVRMGELNNFWKGGITPKNKIFRQGLEYRLWREAVFKRDNYTCVWCGQKGGYLNADHVQFFSTHPELRLALDNGRTLCKECHELRHKKDGYK